jgi:hypothetical protein
MQKLNIRPLGVTDVAKIVGLNASTIHTTATCENWPGKPSKRGCQWKIPSEFVCKRFNIKAEQIVQFLVSGSVSKGAK